MNIMNMINKDFENLPQRSIYYFLITYPSFVPVNSDLATHEEQQNANTFIKSIYEKLFTNPELLGFKPIPDDSFSDWEQQKAKPGLTQKIRGTISKTEAFISLIFEISLSGNKKGKDNTLSVSKNSVNIKPAALKQLAKFDIKSEVTDGEYIFTFPDNIVNGLTLLADISNKNVKPPKDNRQKPYLLFSRGVFDVNAPYTAEVFGNMLDDRSAFDRLIKFLDDSGYTRIDNKEFNNQISLDYIKNYGNPNDELKWAWSERTRGGIEVVYEEIRKNQPMVSLRVPYFDEILKNSENMNEQVKRFVIQTSKKCDNCRYCVQTDKTGKRPLLFVNVDEYPICPLFCGFQYRWRNINAETVDNMIEMLKFIDELFKTRFLLK